MGRFSRDKGKRIKRIDWVLPQKSKEIRLYHVWANMKYRCSLKDKTHRKNYALRGISVCDEWANDFMSFYKWAHENGYRDDLTIDRIDVNKGYCPSNCRWVNNFVQANNRTDNVVIEFDGKKLTRAQWAKELAISATALNKRLLEYHWTIERALTTPIRKKRLREPTLCIKDNVVVKRYESASDAARAIGGKAKTISSCCLGRIKSYMGFSWRYENEYKQ